MHISIHLWAIPFKIYTHPIDGTVMMSIKVPTCFFAFRCPSRINMGGVQIYNGMAMCVMIKQDCN